MLMFDMSQIVLGEKLQFSNKVLLLSILLLVIKMEGLAEETE